MKRRVNAQTLTISCLTVSTLTLLGTVAACGRTSVSSEQQLIELTAKAATRLKAQNGDAADALQKRNAEATERLLRGLIDKEREERMAADKLLGERIDVLRGDLEQFKTSVANKFNQLDAEDAKLRKEMIDGDAALQSQVDGLKESITALDVSLNKSISNLDITLRSKIESAQEALAKQIEAESEALKEQITAERRARVEALSALESETKVLIDSVDKKIRSDLTAAVEKVQNAVNENAGNLAKAKDELLKVLAEQSSDTQIKFTAMAEELRKAKEKSEADDAKLRVELSNNIATQTNAIRAEMTARLDVVNEAIEAERKNREDLKTELENKFSNNLADAMAAVTSRTDDLANSLKAGLAEAEAKLNAAQEKIDADLAKLSESDKALVAQMATARAEMEAKITENAKQQVITQAALEASKAEYEAKLAAADEETKKLLEAERAKRQQELTDLQNDMVDMKVAQDEKRAELLKQLTNASETLKADLSAQIAALDATTFATMKDVNEKLAQDRIATELKILASEERLKGELSEARAQIETVSAQVEAQARLQEEFQSFVAKNYATKGELKAIENRVEGLDFALDMMGRDFSRVEGEIKAMISTEVANAKAELTDRIGKVEASVSGLRDELGGAIRDYQSEITKVSVQMSSSFKQVRDDMKVQNAATHAALVDMKTTAADAQEKLNYDLMAAIKEQAVNFEALTQGVKGELSDKLVQLAGQVDKTNAELKTEYEAIQAQFAQVAKNEQEIKDQFTKDITALKAELEEVAKVASQGLELAKANQAEIEIVKADIEDQKIYVKERFALTDEQIKSVESNVEKMKDDFNKRLDEVAAQAQEMVANLGEEVKSNFAKVTTDLAQTNAAIKANQNALIGVYTDLLFAPGWQWDASMDTFSSRVSEAQELVLATKVLSNGKERKEKGPLIDSLEKFSALRTAFLRSLQPQQRQENGDRIEFYDKSFVPIMTKCGGNAHASFANALGRDSFDFLADEFISGLIYGERGFKADSLYVQNGQLTDGRSLHHFLMMEAVRNLEGASDDPACMADVKSWANEVLNSTQFDDHRKRISQDPEFQRAVTQFVQSVSGLRDSVDALEARFAQDISGGKKKTIKAALAAINNRRIASRFEKNQIDAMTNEFLGKIAFVISEGADKTFNAIARQEEFDKMVAVQKGFAKAMKAEGDAQDEANAAAAQRMADIEKRTSALENKLNEFSKTQQDVESLKSSLENMNAAMTKALDVLLSLAIKSGDPELIAATRDAGSSLGYKPKDISKVIFFLRPEILEIQHFFASPALANSSNTCTGDTPKPGAGVKFWTKGGQCWVNFRGIDKDRWSSAAGTIWFRVFGAAKEMKVRSKLCKGVNNTCNAHFKFDNGVSQATVLGGSGVSAKMIGSQREGVFDIQMPKILEPYLNSAANPSWQGEEIYFNAIGSGDASTGDVGYKVQLYSPIILDFMPVGRPELTRVDQSDVKFDLDGNKIAERTGWIKGRRNVGLLALDLNNNGVIDDGTEMFGEGTRMAATGRRAKDGYAALAQHDTNKDGLIDSKDEVFHKLVVWFDHNENGKTEKGEIVPLSQAGVTKVGLKYSYLKDEGRFVNGNELRMSAQFWGPKQCGTGGCNSYDVYFGTSFTVSKKD